MTQLRCPVSVIGLKRGRPFLDDAVTLEKWRMPSSAEQSKLQHKKRLDECAVVLFERLQEERKIAKSSFWQIFCDIFHHLSFIRGVVYSMEPGEFMIENYEIFTICLRNSHVKLYMLKKASVTHKLHKLSLTIKLFSHLLYSMGRIIKNILQPPFQVVTRTFI